MPQPDRTAEQTAMERDPHNGGAAHAVFAATAQMGLALRESQDPVAELGDLCANLSATLAELRSRQSQNATDSELLDRLQADVSAGIQQLQFYDRMVQHLTHIQQYLISVANELDSEKTQAQAQEVWHELHARLRKRLISDAQRGLLDLFLSPHVTTHVSAQAPRPEYSPPGSSELF